MNQKLVVGALGLAALAAAYVVLPLMAGGTSTGQFSAYQKEEENGDGWDGAYLARQALVDNHFEVRNFATSPLILDDVDAANTMVIVCGMSKPYSPAEQDTLDAFMRSGGVLLLLDDYGYGGDYADKYNIGYRTRPVFDKDFQKNQSFVKVHADFSGVSYDVLFNSPSALTDVDENVTRFTGVEKFMQTSNFSYMDLNANGIIDVVDKVGPFNVGLTLPVGVEGGRLIVISDSGWLTNEMMRMKEEGVNNEGFLLALVSTFLENAPVGPSGELAANFNRVGMVLFDESRRDVVGIETGFYMTERSMMNLLRTLPAIGIVLSMGLVLQASIQLVRLPGLESWYHRFLPNTYVPPPADVPPREVLKNILQIKQALDSTGVGKVDPLLERAAKDPASVPDAEVPILLRRITAELELDIPQIGDDAKASSASSKEAKGANPRPAGKAAPSNG